MPIYEYRCEDCETAFEKLVRAFREEVACPHCGSAELERLLSTFAMSGTGSAGAGPLAGSGGACSSGGCGCGASGCGCRH